MRAVEERKSAERDQARARIEDSMKIIESTHSETEAARESLNAVLLSMQEHQAGIEKINDLLRLGQYAGISILRAADFLQRLRE